MVVQPIDINLPVLNKVTGLLCSASNEIKQGKNKEILNIKTIIRIKQKIKMLELRYDLLKKWGKGDTQLELIKQKFDVIKHKMRKIEF